MPVPRFRLSSLPAELQSAIAAIRTAFFATAGASALVNLLMLVGPIFMLQIYDRVLPSRSISTLVGLLLIVLVLLMVQAAVDAVRSRLLSRMGEAFDEAMRDQVFDSVHHAALTRAERRRPADHARSRHRQGLHFRHRAGRALRPAVDAALYPGLHDVPSADGTGRGRRRHRARPDHGGRRNFHARADPVAGRAGVVAPADGGNRLPSCRGRARARHEAAHGGSVVAAHARPISTRSA